MPVEGRAEAPGVHRVRAVGRRECPLILAASIFRISPVLGERAAGARARAASAIFSAASSGWEDAVPATRRVLAAVHRRAQILSTRSAWAFGRRYAAPSCGWTSAGKTIAPTAAAADTRRAPRPAPSAAARARALR